MFRQIRILILLVILATVGLSAWRANSRLTAWEHSVHVAIYPMAADAAPASASYVASLNADSFAEIGEWAQQESKRYGRSVLQPVVLHVAPALRELPPLPPRPASTFDTLLWSLKLRWWASQHDRIDGPKPHVRLFVLFHDPARHGALPHSTGLEKGQIGLIHAFASRQQRGQNNVVIAHELLHTFGASDKYELATSQPIFPQGYADPAREPRWPQAQAEIMGGRIPLTSETAEIPASLADTVIGQETAQEIGLLRSTR